MPATQPQLRRATSLVAYWQGGEFVVENYLSGGQIIAHPAVLQLIDSLGGFRPRPEIREQLRASLGSDDIFEVLCSQDILIAEGTALERKEQLLERWPWQHETRYFHFATQRVEYTFDFQAIREHLEQKAREDPPPSPFKTHEGLSIELPATGELPIPLDQVLTRRRTMREFARSPIGLAKLSALLKWTWGMQRYFNQSQLDRRILKTSPSGGARHPIEVYPVVQRVGGVEPGAYHYNVQRHRLTLLRLGLFEHQMVDLFSGQHWVRDAAVLFFMTAVLPRSMWKYEHARAYRVVQLDAGHLGQTFHLVCTALDLGPFTTAALQDEAVEALLGLDGVNDVSIYAAAAGNAKGRIGS